MWRNLPVLVRLLTAMIMPLCLGVLTGTYNDAAGSQKGTCISSSYLCVLPIVPFGTCLAEAHSHYSSFIMHVTATKPTKTTVILPDLFKGFVVQTPRVNKDYSTVKPISEQWLSEYVVHPRYTGNILTEVRKCQFSPRMKKRVEFCDFALFISIAAPDAPYEKLKTMCDWGNWVSRLCCHSSWCLTNHLPSGLPFWWPWVCIVTSLKQYADSNSFWWRIIEKCSDKSPTCRW